jgi:hypothetical protein
MNVYLVNSRFTEPAGKGVLALSILFASSLPALLWGPALYLSGIGRTSSYFNDPPDLACSNSSGTPL